MKADYKELYEKMTNLFQLSIKEKSIHFHLDIERDKVFISSFLVTLTGEKEEFETVEYMWGEEFYKEFLLPLITLIHQKCHVITSDMIPSNRESLYIVRFLTENNDIFTIEGFNEEDAKGLLNQFKNITDIHLFD